MTTLPEALRLAKALEQGKYLLSVERDATAAELRRLYQLCMDQQGEIYALNMARSMEQKAAALVAAAEREACAQLVENFYTSNPNMLAAAIRARGE